MAMKNEESQLNRIEQAIILATLATKNALTFDEGVIFAGISHSHMYKLTSGGIVPHYKPRGKMIYFDRAELEKWLLQNRVTPADEIEAMATTYIATGRKGVNHV